MRYSKTVIAWVAAVIWWAGACYAQEAFSYPGGGQRDPFSPLINSQGVLNIRLIRQEGDLQLNGIIYDNKETERIAIINNEPLRMDDCIGAYTIKEIHKGSVLLMKEGKTIELKMGGDDEG